VRLLQMSGSTSVCPRKLRHGHQIRYPPTNIVDAHQTLNDVTAASKYFMTNNRMT
jgi:hypothetical protein